MWDSSAMAKASRLHIWAPCLQFHGPRAGTLRFVRGAVVRSTCIPSSSLDWLVRATSRLFERGDALAPAHRLWATTSGRAPEEVGAWISRWGHTRTHSAADGSHGERQRWPPPRHSLPVSTRTRCNSLFFRPVGPPSGTTSPRCCRLSLPPWPRTVSAPLATTLS